MSLIVKHSDMFAIARPYLAPGEAVEHWIDRLKGHPHEWRTWLRRLYVLTWPLSFLTRIAIFVAVGVTWLVLSAGGFIAARLAYIWHGERSPWE